MFKSLNIKEIYFGIFAKILAQGGPSFSDAMILEDVVKDVVGGEEVFSEDGVDGGEGAAEVFGDEVGGEAGAHGGEDVA